MDIGTNAPLTCRVEEACRVAYRLTISNIDLEETALQVPTELVETKRKGCMDETVETKGTLERKSTEDEKGNQTVDKLAEDVYNKL